MYQDIVFETNTSPVFWTALKTCLFETMPAKPTSLILMLAAWYGGVGDGCGGKGGDGGVDGGDDGG